MNLLIFFQSVAFPFLFFIILLFLLKFFRHLDKELQFSCINIFHLCIFIDVPKSWASIFSPVALQRIAPPIASHAFVAAICVDSPGIVPMDYQIACSMSIPHVRPPLWHWQPLKGETNLTEKISFMKIIQIQKNENKIITFQKCN